MRKYIYYDVIWNNYLCGNLGCYKEYVDIKFNKKIKKIKKKIINEDILY